MTLFALVVLRVFNRGYARATSPPQPKDTMLYKNSSPAPKPGLKPWMASGLPTWQRALSAAVDAFTTVIALISQVLMVYRFREQWIGWLVLNAVQVYLWSTVEGGGNMAIMAMYLGFIANSIYGWYNWTKLSRKS